MKRINLTWVTLSAVLGLLATLFSARSASATTYYVATSGSDSNNGTSESTPWAHLPGMPTATGTAGNHSAVAGDTFVLRGCDVWYNANLPVVLNNKGFKREPCDNHCRSTWYNLTNCPSAWNRPVFDAHTSSSSSTGTEINGSGGQASGCVPGERQFLYSHQRLLRCRSSR